jgi:short chain dehydrogenase
MDWYICPILALPCSLISPSFPFPHTYLVPLENHPDYLTNTPTGIYASSKSALTNLSDTLRLELAPLGVSVITLMAGTVSTPFDANEPSFVLPPTSRYAAIKDTIARWASGEAGPKSCTPEEFAESVVEDIIGKGKGGQLWKGPNSGTVKLVSKWVPVSMLVRSSLSALFLLFYALPFLPFSLFADSTYTKSAYGSSI